jgi:hypothetical protein
MKPGPDSLRNCSALLNLTNSSKYFKQRAVQLGNEQMPLKVRPEDENIQLRPLLLHSVVKPHHFDAAPDLATSRQNDAAPVPVLRHSF